MLSFLVDNLCFFDADRSQVLAQGNAAPIAVNDPLTVLRGSDPVTVDVLGNDVDPEGQALTLVSAFAALGTAVAESDGTVTYTPPQGPPAETVDFDTVVYEIEDVAGNRDTGEVSVSIADADVAILQLPDNTLAVTAGPGPIEITITDPVGFAGTYTVDLRDLDQGPVNLVPAVVSGEVTVGTQLSATSGLWISDVGAGTPSQTIQWQRGETDIPGATGTSYQVQPGDVGQALRVIETLIDGFGTRSTASNALGSFSPAADPQIIGWWDASDVSTITEGSAGGVEAWADKMSGLALAQTNGAREPTTGVRQVGGLNVIDFDGGDFLEAALSLPGSGDVAFHMVLAIDSTANAFEAVLSVDATNDFQIDANNDTAFDGRLNLAGAGSSVTLTGGPFAGTMILSAVFDRTGSGTAEVFIADALRGTTGYSQALDPSQTLIVMANRSKNAWINGALAEVVITGDTSNRPFYHAYLSAKWGIS